MASIAYLDLVIGGLVTTIVIVAVPLVLRKAGGWPHVTATLPATHFQVLGNLTLPQALNFMIPTMLLLIGNQGMYQKFFSAKSERDAKYAVYGWIAGTLTLETLLVTLAVIGSSLFQAEHPREIIPITAFRGLPSLVGALLLGGIFAKVISTANNYLFSPSTNLIHDVYGRFINPAASQARKLGMSRLIVVLLGLFALLQATRFESILNAAVYAYTVYGAAVTPAVFFWKRATTAGAIASIALGAAITVGLNLAGYELAIYPALGASVVSLIVVSLCTAAPSPQKWKPFFETDHAT
jgi:SSS family solute:Na+ symporter/sodium/proline symporter